MIPDCAVAFEEVTVVEIADNRLCISCEEIGTHPVWIPTKVVMVDTDEEEEFRLEHGYVGRMLIQETFARSKGWI